jgi:hypothetical protein
MESCKKRARLFSFCSSYYIKKPCPILFSKSFARFHLFDGSYYLLRVGLLPPPPPLLPDPLLPLLPLLPLELGR